MKGAIIIGSDHAGFALKEKLRKFLAKKGIDCIDAGTFSEESVDYPDFALKVAKAAAKGKRKGILICGTGIGMSIAANKVRGVRAALCSDTDSAIMSRLHNDANVLCLSARNFPYGKAEKIAKAWLGTEFSGEPKHKRRIKKISAFESRK